MEDLSVYREVFLEELAEQLDRMEQDLLVLEKDQSYDIINSIFRAAHTIKGSSAAIGFEEMKSLTHEMEHLLDLVRGNKLQVDRPLIDLLFESLDQLKVLRDEYVAGRPFSEITGLLNKQQSFVHETEKQPFRRAEFPELSLDESLRVEEAVETGFRVMKIQLRLSDDCRMKAPRLHLIRREIKDHCGELLFSMPDITYNEAPDDDDCSEPVFLVKTLKDPEEIQAVLSRILDVNLAAVEPYHQMNKAKPNTAASGPQDPHECKPKHPQTIRVSVERLEHLMNLVGELLIDQTTLSQVKQTLSLRYANEDAVDRLSDVSDHMACIVDDLQESIMKARMLPIEHLFNRFPRMVRDLSQQLGKEVELVLEGMETELDRTLIEELGDPLIHLIRNAVDHGIGTAAARIEKGKPPVGRVRLNSYHEDNQVVITVEDDGEGINPDKVKASAVKKGMITEEEVQTLSDHEAIRLIFQPGFSTAASVSDVSGRGVGMDIVRNKIERLNGLIDIQTELHKGTRFTVRLPLTLAIITGLMVQVCGRDFVIPMNNVVEIVRIPQEKIQTVQGESMIVIRNELMPLIWLHRVLRYEKTEPVRKSLPVVVVGSAERKVALAVDELLGNQEIVIKTLGSYLGKIPYISGATILGNGRVSLILEIAYLIQQSRKR